MPEPVLDTMVIQVMTFAHPIGLDLLLHALATPRARFPPEVYARDEDALPLSELDDERLSELARGLRYARRRVESLSAQHAARYATWLTHSAQLRRHLDAGSLMIDPLTIQELVIRERLMVSHRIGRGEAAGLTLVLRDDAAAVFVSSDQIACRVALELGIPHLTLPTILERWVTMERPSTTQFQELIDGMAAARFRLSDAERLRLRQLLD